MRRAGSFRAFVIAAALVAAPAFAFALEEQSLLTPDGTLHVVRTGRAIDLGIAEAPSPESILIEHSSRTQDGTVTSTILPDSISYQEKRGLQLGYDEQAHTLLLLWTEDIAAYSHIRVGVLKEGAWTNRPLLPSQGISRASGATMLITHQRVTYLDESDAPVSKTSSIVSVVWWEEAQLLQARLAILFLDENDFDSENLAIYDVPALTGGYGASVYNDVPEGAYQFPSLQADGLSGAFLASYADLHADRHRVLRISFPEDQGKPTEMGNSKWKRRHIPIVGVEMEGPIARKAPWRSADKRLSVGTTVGSGYQPTLYWLDGSSLRYMRLAGGDWEPILSISIDDTMTYDRALALVVGMGQRN